MHERITTVAVLLMCCELTACTRAKPITVYEEAREVTSAVDPEPTIIFRTSSYPDAELASRGLGTIAVVVRVAEQPLRVVANARILVSTTNAGRDSERMTDDRGQAQFDSIAVGRQQVTVRAIGYGPAKLEAPISPGCRTDIEVYIGIQAIGIAPPPPQPGRVVITTCRPDR
jgi:hypothetical protein